jgi:hypothetical protein
VIVDVARLDAAGHLEDCVGDAWERVRHDVQDGRHRPIGASIYVGLIADRVAKLLDLLVEECEGVAEEVLLRPRRRIINRYHPGSTPRAWRPQESLWRGPATNIDKRPRSPRRSRGAKLTDCFPKETGGPATATHSDVPTFDAKAKR